MVKTMNFTHDMKETVALAEKIYPFLSSKEKITHKINFILDDWRKLIEMELYRQRTIAEMNIQNKRTQHAEVHIERNFTNMSREELLSFVQLKASEPPIRPTDQCSLLYFCEKTHINNLNSTCSQIKTIFCGSA